MGNSSSNEDDAQKVGYRVLGVQANSPAAAGGLVSFFDFIVEANGIPLRTLDSTFIDLIKASEDKPLPLLIYNWKNKSHREIILTPSRNWPGEGMLGVTIRFDSYKDAEEQMLHVLEIEPNSPAELAGLSPFKDYLLGTAEKAFTDADVLFQELSDHLDRPVEFYVYNTDTDEVRVVVLMPTEDWGGEGERGILGANVAYGYLHVLPSHCCDSIGVSNASEANKSISSPFGLNYQTPSMMEALHIPIPPPESKGAVFHPPISASYGQAPGAEVAAGAITAAQLPHPSFVHTTQTPRHGSSTSASQEGPLAQPLA